MNHYLLQHEAYMQRALLAQEIQNWKALKCYHKTQIEFMQHERLIHLLVTIAVAFFFLGSVSLTIIYSQVFLLLLVMILGVLEIFYIIHYYHLENGVQRMYDLYNKICEKETEHDSVI
ncbi:MAG: hypothetical protein WCI30_09550 [Clostridia bacterium]